MQLKAENLKEPRSSKSVDHLVQGRAGHVRSAQGCSGSESRSQCCFGH